MKSTLHTKTTIVATAVFNPERMREAQQYMQRAIPLLINGGGEVICRIKVDRAVIGDSKYNACLVMNFPSVSAVEAVFKSEAYAEIIPLREAGFKSMDIVVASSM